jgi:glycosyltransferase involved in cell wall biosynthesis
MNHDVICFANDWAADPLSKKHVMVRFARTRKVLWINAINNRAPQLGRRDLRRVLEKLKQFTAGLRMVDSNIWVLAPIFIPFHGNRLVQWLNRRLLGYQIRTAVRKLGLKNYISWVYVPTAAHVVGELGEQSVVYHCVDEYGAFSDATSAVAACERELLSKSRLVITSSSKLQESKSSLNPNCHLVTHGVDYDHFRSVVQSAGPVAPELKDLPRPILGFHGLVADWVDLNLLAELARKRPEWSLVIVGRVDTDVSCFAGLSNVHLIGHRPYSRLPEYLRGFDVAVLPFVVNELTRAANPLKLREYLAAGLPVIGAPIPEIERMGSLVRIGHSAPEYEQHVLELMQAHELGPSNRRSELMYRESWDHKVEELDCLLQKATAAPGRFDKEAAAAR